LGERACDRGPHGARSLAQSKCETGFESESLGDTNQKLNFIHRTDGGTQIYFVANRSTNEAI